MLPLQLYSHMVPGHVHSLIKIHHTLKHPNKKHVENIAARPRGITEIIKFNFTMLSSWLFIAAEAHYVRTARPRSGGGGGLRLGKN